MTEKSARTTKFISACVLLLLGSTSAWAGASSAKTGEIVINHVGNLHFMTIKMRGEVEGDKAHGFKFVVPGKEFDVKCSGGYPSWATKDPYNHMAGIPIYSMNPNVSYQVGKIETYLFILQCPLAGPMISEFRKIDKGENFRTLLKKAMRGDVSALINLEYSAKSGDARAETYLGIAYYYGKGMPQDYAKAVYWFQKAAQQGFARAEFGLGVNYYKGQGVPQDYAKAIYWFQKAARQGYAEAEYNLGVNYYKGRGVPKNYAKAIYWFQKAAQKGYARAEFDLGAAYYHGYGVPQNSLKALHWLKKAANKNLPKAKKAIQIIERGSAG